MAAGDMFPVRVMVETVRSQHCLGCAHDGNPLVDTFAVIGGQTMVSQLVETVLAALGLPQLVQDSKGLIQINGWKPISFETITDNPEELVINLFREISTHITLKILAKRSSSEPNGQCLAELKQRLLKTAIEKQPEILTTSNGQEVKEILQQVIQGDQECSTWTNREQTEAVNEWLEQMAAQQGESRKSPCSTKFSPVSELPRLERWFRSDPNPSRQKLLNFMNILNTSPYRRANNKVTYQQICNWFINQRRTAQRQNGSRQPSSTQQQQKMPMVMLPLNATGSTNVNSAPNNLMLLNSLATALTNGSMDPAQVQQKIATILTGMGEECQKRSGSHRDHQIPLANGPPMDIRSKFDGTNNEEHSAEQNGTNGHQQEGQQSSGQHSDRMDGGSESPTGNDYMSEESGSCGGGAGEIRDSIACSPDELYMDVQQQGPPEATTTTNGERNNNGNAMDDGGEEQNESGQHENLQQVAQSAAAAAAAAAGLNLSQLFHQSGHGQQTSQPVMAAAAAAAFQTLMPTQSQLHLMNQLAMASQFQQQQQGLSPATPHHQHQQPQSSNPFGRPNSASGPPLKSSPSSNSLMALNREESNCATGSNIKLEAGFSSPSQNANGTNGSQNGPNNGNNSQSRSRLMFDPLSELPILERWFEENPHPGWLQIEQYTDYLNSMAYRQNYPPISTHNVKIWFKNRRAKTKRLLGNNDCSIQSTSAV